MKTFLAFTLFFTTNLLAQPVPPVDTLHFAEGALKVELKWLLGPRTPAVSEMKMEWKNGTDQTRVEPPGPVKVTLWMPMHGHPGHNHGHPSSPVTLTKLGAEAGVYQASDMYFTMQGDWEVRVKLKYSNGREETQVLTVHAISK